jgi:hypothetical protein
MSGKDFDLDLGTFTIESGEKNGMPLGSATAPAEFVRLARLGLLISKLALIKLDPA